MGIYFFIARIVKCIATTTQNNPYVAKIVPEKILASGAIPISKKNIQKAVNNCAKPPKYKATFARLLPNLA